MRVGKEKKRGENTERGLMQKKMEYNMNRDREGNRKTKRDKREYKKVIRYIRDIDQY